MSSQRGFTLIELMIVVVVIGILAALAIPQFGVAATKAREKEADGVLKSLYTMQTAYHSKTGAYTADTVVLRLEVGWSPPTGLQYYTQPAITAGASTFAACMTGISGGVTNRSVDQTGAFGTC